MAKTAATAGGRGEKYAIKRRVLEHSVAKFGERYRFGVARE
ncbi:MAG TPA: hypothetical protein VEC57_09165 [Candidatus Limnocylindrales bacterium]|nr:hypothetical protein [Candidatus Limnocylindrales bacterium]